VEEVASSYVGIGGERRGGVSFDIDIFSDIRRASGGARFRIGRTGRYRRMDIKIAMLQFGTTSMVFGYNTEAEV
jgi:hypothetical protein